MARTGIRASAIIIQDGKILLIHRHKNGQEYWVFPGGGVEEGETVEQTFVREVEEETSLKIINFKLGFRIQNNPYFYCEVGSGVPHLIGEELYKNSPVDHYQPEWIDATQIKNLNILPLEAKQQVLSKL